MQPVESPAELGVAARLQLLDSLGFGVWVYDGRDVRYVNEALAAITGYSREEMLQPGFFRDLVHPDHAEALVERGQARVRGEEVEHAYELPIRARDGSERWLSVRADRVELPEGAMSLVSCVDVTARRQLQAQLTDGTERVLKFLDQLPLLVLASDTEGRAGIANANFRSYFGLPEGPLNAQELSDVAHPDDAPLVAQHWCEAQRTTQGYDLDCRVRSATGEYRWYSFRIRPVQNTQGAISGWTTVGMDIHESKELHLQLGAANEELARANRTKDEILSLVSHELRTPMTTLLGNTDLLRRRGDELDEDDRRGLIDDMATDAKRLYSIIENMLVLARPQTLDDSIEPVLIGRVVAQAVEELRARMPSRPIELQIDEQVPPVLGNQMFVEQIVQNLVSNADKYTPRGTPVLVRVGLAGEFALLCVADRGPGINADEFEKIFQPFYRSDELSSKAFGIGLGLTVCQRLTESMGGTITATNREGGGAEFHIRIPLIDSKH
jgi:PAS domain S-box-containing protein